ncbi:MAG: ABC transporter ATP-binding protein [Euryarchaeota archaeon]|jgi:putative ABC transport system ATP-binding protein|nr:ABC transporter ATP-binding protein [Euryarchaeota archaeon]MBT3654476.1 ABC transporter ATP-binding protein [Euryarchaeota archaeon]MBT3757974.1 ABC transporter ATP-binding protein [Euryarchaeota archaeon]MBT4050802.1 ABC transporter ATP-binding protein [Euryarchaeota archaeon]MBT4346454.1 ABC transporter ATP-binding protein [Euryarchaeota archaeon]|tara:strand:- start:567 stop:1553 length:987 start_codon:yes stop_codon:yes gene_type:complete
MDEKSYILEADSLYHVYESKAEEGNVVALRGLSVKVEQGEAVAVIGPSGSGKSTLLKSLGGLMTPTAGRVFLDGSDMTKLEGADLVEHRRSTVSFIFQEGNLLPDLSGLDNVMQPLRHAGIPAPEAKRQAVAVLERLGMTSRMKALPEQLSGGEQQRIAIARALITKPKLILADEPTGSLDPFTSQSVLDLFRELHKEEDVAFLIVTHSHDVADFSDRSLELRDGRFVAQHGEGIEVNDLIQNRELILDDIGTVSFPPDILLKLGGPGRYAVELIEPGRITLVSQAAKATAAAGNHRIYVANCPACDHEYGSTQEKQCPDCGSSRPKR